MRDQQRPRAGTYRRRRLAVLGSGTVLLALSVYFPSVLLAPVEASEAVVAEYIAPSVESAELAWPSSQSVAIGAVGFPGILDSRGVQDAAPIASITKLVTALTVLDAKPLASGERGPTIAFDRDDVAQQRAYLGVGAATEPVKAGLELSEYEVLQLVLISSAANYASSLTDWAFGSEDAFVHAADAWLAVNGLSETTIVEPTGLDPRNTSTPGDLIELAKISHSHPVIAEIVAQREVTLPYVGVIENSNDLLGTGGIDGIKTGTLEEAGACLLFSSDLVIGEHTVTVVGVALGGQSHRVQFPQISQLLATVEGRFHSVPIADAGDAFATFTTEWGSSADAVVGESLSMLLWGETLVTADVDLDSIAVGERGTDVGTVTFTAGEQRASLRLELGMDIPSPSPGWRIANPLLVLQ